MNPTEKLSASLEDYLICIYRLADSGNKIVKISAISAELGCSKPSVCRATDILDGMGLLEKHRYKGFVLTSCGFDYAKALYERYDLLYRFLTEVLGLNKSTAARDACGLEHAVSEECRDAIAQYLNKGGSV